MKREKIIKSCVLYDSAEEFDYDEYVQFCEDCGIKPAEEYSQDYWDCINRWRDNDWDDFKSNLTYAGANNQPCMIIGSDGLWDGRHEIIPVLCDTIFGAIEKCLNVNSMFEVDIVLTDGHLDVNVHHHDGTNCYEIWLLSERGKKEVARPIYQWEKDYEPKRNWFKLIRGYLF